MSLPIVLLAFAADRQGTFLRSISEEHDTIAGILRVAEDAGQIRVITLANVTAQRIVDTFQEYRDAIKVFHYGGHADGGGLLVDSGGGEVQSIDGKSFADFLAKQPGLELVFLNGCSSQGQSQGLLDAGAKTVIATSVAINDESAKDFSRTFYNSLVTGAPLIDAFDEAGSAVMMKSGGKTRSLYWDVPEATKSEMPWKLFGQESGWKLTEAARDIILMQTVEKAQTLVQQARTKDALKAIVDLLKERNHPMLQQFVQVQSSFTANEKNNLMGILSSSEYNMERNKATHSLLTLLGTLTAEQEA